MIEERLKKAIDLIKLRDRKSETEALLLIIEVLHEMNKMPIPEREPEPLKMEY